MNNLSEITAILALIGSLLVAGIFFAFSSFIMKALARLPSSEGIAAMQSINIVVINPTFLTVFIGTTAISLMLVIISIWAWGVPASPYFLIGGLLYVVGTFLVTGMGNVPLNNQLAEMNANDPRASDIWQLYLVKWTWLNTIRTICTAVAAMVILVGLLI
ncbi:MAG: DUF1772 domain-containing protein [Gammaproteobacteria bacterium]|nr:DUF1772 domain-containing protein [Gammaproteobacteria bacterium]